MLSYLEKFALFLTLMTIISFLSRIVDLSEFKYRRRILFMAIASYVSYYSCFAISIINLFIFLFKILEGLIK